MTATLQKSSASPLITESLWAWTCDTIAERTGSHVVDGLPPPPHHCLVRGNDGEPTACLWFYKFEGVPMAMGLNLAVAAHLEGLEAAAALSLLMREVSRKAHIEKWTSVVFVGHAEYMKIFKAFGAVPVHNEQDAFRSYLINYPCPQ